jgi:PAS domain S-box-containing protein
MTKKNNQPSSPKPFVNHQPNLPLKDRAIDDQLFIKDRAIASSIQGIGIGDLEGRIVYINDAAVRMWGAASASEVIGRSSLEFAKSQEQAIRVMLHVLENGSWEGEIEGKRKDGSPIFVHLSANIVYNDDGEPICTMDSFVDITDRKKMEAELRIKEFAIASSVQGIGIGDLGGNITYVNKAAMKMWGEADPSEILGRSSLDFAESHEEALKIMCAVLEHGSWEGEVRGRRKDGSPIIVYLSANIVYNDKGEPVCTMDSFIDITDRKKMEEELRIKDLAIASAIDAIVIADLLGNITYVNQAFLDMWGDNDASAVLGRSAISFAKDQKMAEIIFERILDQGSWSGEIDGVKKKGDVITVLFAGSVVMDANNHPLCMMGSFSDITYRKQAEEKLAAVNEELEIRVAARTRELMAANQKLKIEIEERKLIENSLRQKEQELSLQAVNLQETNTALKILLNQRVQDKEDTEAMMMANIKDLILPYIEKLKNTRLDERQKTCLERLDENLSGIASPYLQKMSTQFKNLTPMQIQIADLVKAGKSTKEIADLLSLSDRAIEFHRNSLRSKLGLKNKKQNLRSYLLSLPR